MTKTEALARARRAARGSIRASEARDDAIRAAAQAGASLSEIATAVGLSKPRVYQIVSAT